MRGESVTTPHAACHEEILSRDVTLISEIYVGAIGGEQVGIHLTGAVDEYAHHLCVAPKLIADGEHGEGGVMGIIAEYALEIVGEESCQFGILIIDLTPYRELRLEVDPRLIGGSETGLRGTP